MMYRDAMLGELRLLECFGVAESCEEFPVALHWTPRPRMSYRAPMLKRYDDISGSLSAMHGLKRMYEALSGVLTKP